MGSSSTGRPESSGVSRLLRGRMRSEAADRADFSEIRYAQVWEDADVLLDGLDVRPGDVCLSIASAGDNALALLTGGPARVVALDLSPAQLACLELRVAAYRELEHPELLELVGSRPSARRHVLYRLPAALSTRRRGILGRAPRRDRPRHRRRGEVRALLRVFRRRVLPLVHRGHGGGAPGAPRPRGSRSASTGPVGHLALAPALPPLLLAIVMGRLGRDPEFFRYVEGDVADRILARTRHALTELDPSENPYVHWILTGTHGAALPCALREETSRPSARISIASSGARPPSRTFSTGGTGGTFDRFNLSDLFEYVSLEHYHRLLGAIVGASRPRARLAYWNMLVPRERPAEMAGGLSRCPSWPGGCTCGIGRSSTARFA